MSIDEDLAKMAEKKAAIAAALQEFNAEQAAGRFGLDAYHRHKTLNEELITLGAAIAARMDEALASI